MVSDIGEYYDPLPSKARVRLWMGDFDQAIQLGQRFLGKKRTAKFPVARMGVTIDMAEVHQRTGHVHLAVGMLMDVLREARSKAIAEVELHALRCLADAHRLRGDYTSARTFLDDLDEIAARGPYRLIQADAANIRALLLDADRSQRRAEAERAYKLAWCDGPPFAYHRALELAAGTLHDLDAPLPQESQGTTDS